MEEPDIWEVNHFLKLLDETIRNTAIVNWYKIREIFNFVEKRRDWQFFMTFISIELEKRLKNQYGPYIIMQILIILELITKKYQNRKIWQDPIIIRIIDQLILYKTTNDNIRKKIGLFVLKWPYGRQISNRHNAKNLMLEGPTISDDVNTERRKVPEGFCYKCVNRKSHIICASCVQLFCNECSLKTLTLPKFGFPGQVKVCDDCYNKNFSSSSDEASAPGDQIPSQSKESVKHTANEGLMKAIECPICLDIMQKPIIQCKLGHSMCQACTIGKLTICPICRDEITSTRNYVVEQLIENQETSCGFANKGCTEIVKLHEKKLHETKCDFRQIHCEGKKFCNWKCNWTGSFNEIEQHFNDIHRNILIIPHKTTAVEPIVIKFNKKKYNMQFVNFRYGKAYFWCKHKLDIISRNAYWAVQMIGSKEEAANYAYEFTIFNGSIRKFRVTEICNNDSVDPEEIFNSKKCIVVPFDILKSYLNEKNEVATTLSIFNILL